MAAGIKRSCEVYDLDFENKQYKYKQDVPLDEELLTDATHCRVCKLFSDWFYEEDTDGNAQ